MNAHHHDGARCGQARKDVHDGGGVGAVQPRRGLVQEHHPGVHQKLGSNAHAALLPAGYSASELVPDEAGGHFGQAEHGKHLPRPSFDFLLRRAPGKP